MNQEAQSAGSGGSRDGARDQKRQTEENALLERLGEADSGTMEGGGAMELRKELGEARKYLAGPGRVGLVSMVSKDDTVTETAGNRLLFAKLATLPLAERCALVLRTCEAQWKNIRVQYVLRGKKKRTIAECCVLSTDLSPDSIMQVLESRSGGWFALCRLADHARTTVVEVLERAGGIDRYLGFLKKESPVRVAHLQGEAFKSSSSKTLEWLIDVGLYDAVHNSRLTLLVCENEFGLKKLVEEGYDPSGEAEWSDIAGDQPLSAEDRSARMVDALLAVGAKIDRLSGRVTPSAAALRRMLQLQPAVTRAKFTGEVVMCNLKLHLCALYHVQVMREFDYPAPDVSCISDFSGRFPGPLFTFRYIRDCPTTPSRKDDIMRFFWRPHTHCLCDDALHFAIKTTLMCLKRLCALMPKDICNLLLGTTFGNVAFDGARQRSADRVR